jgi:hypothetical protein
MVAVPSSSSLFQWDRRLKGGPCFQRHRRLKVPVLDRSSREASLKQTQLPFRGFDVVANDASLVCGKAIENQTHGFPAPTHQLAQELNEQFAVQPTHVSADSLAGQRRIGLLLPQGNCLRIPLVHPLQRLTSPQTRTADDRFFFDAADRSGYYALAAGSKSVLTPHAAIVSRGSCGSCSPMPAPTPFCYSSQGFNPDSYHPRKSRRIAYSTAS